MNYNLEELEKYRSQVIGSSKKYYYIAGGFLALAIICFAVLFLLDNAPDAILYIAVIAFVGAICFFAIAGTQRSKAKNKIKAELITGLLKEHCGNDVIYIMNNTLPELNEIVKLGLVERPDRVLGGDYYSAVYNNIRFSASDVELQEKVVYKDSDGKTQTRYDTYFKGRMMVFNLENLPQEMYFIEKGSKIRRIRSLEKVQTEISLLNEKYNIGVSNKEEIFHYLTPVVLQGFIKFEEQVGGIISYVFYNKKLYLFIENCEDSLEVNLGRAIDERQISHILGGLRLPLDVIDSFKLNDKFFKKE